MTPHNWRTKADKKESLASLEALTVTIDAQIHVFKAKVKAPVEVGEIEESAEEVITEAKPTTSGTINPWAKSTVEAEPVSEIVPEMPAQTPAELPVEAAIEMPVEAPVEIEEKDDTKEIPSGKVNPWAKS